MNIVVAPTPPSSSPVPEFNQLTVGDAVIADTATVAEELVNKSTAQTCSIGVQTESHCTSIDLTLPLWALALSVCGDNELCPSKSETAERLAGAFNKGTDTSTSDSASMSPFPLYSDAVQVILRYLNVCELIVSAQLSKQWYHALKTTHSLGVASKAKPDKLARMPINSAIARHIATATYVSDAIEKSADMVFKGFSLSHQLAKLLPNLKTLNIHPIKDIDTYNFPPKLQQIVITTSSQCNTLFLSLSQLKHLRELRLILSDSARNFDFCARNFDFSSLTSLSQLETLGVDFSLSGGMPYSDYMNFRNFVRRSRIRHLSLVSCDRVAFGCVDLTYVEILNPTPEEPTFPLMESGNFNSIELPLSSDPLDETLLRVLANYPSLTKLSAQPDAISSASMSLLSKLPNLAEFTFLRHSETFTLREFSQIGDAIVSACQFLPNLRILRIHDWSLSTQQLDECLSRLPFLTHLETGGLYSLAPLVKHNVPKRLTKLKLTYFSVSVDDIRDYILSLHKLEDLYLEGTAAPNLPVVLLKQIRGMPRMTTCHLNINSAPVAGFTFGAIPSAAVSTASLRRAFPTPEGTCSFDFSGYQPPAASNFNLVPVAGSGFSFGSSGLTPTEVVTAGETPSKPRFSAAAAATTAALGTASDSPSTAGFSGFEFGTTSIGPASLSSGSNAASGLFGTATTATSISGFSFGAPTIIGQTAFGFRDHGFSFGAPLTPATAPTTTPTSQAATPALDGDSMAAGLGAFGFSNRPSTFGVTPSVAFGTAPSARTASSGQSDFGFGKTGFSFGSSPAPKPTSATTASSAVGTTITAAASLLPAASSFSTHDSRSTEVCPLYSDVIQVIFRYLSANELISSAQLSKKWYQCLQITPSLGITTGAHQDKVARMPTNSVLARHVACVTDMRNALHTSHDLSPDCSLFSDLGVRLPNLTRLDMTPIEEISKYSLPPLLETLHVWTSHACNTLLASISHLNHLRELYLKLVHCDASNRFDYSQLVGLTQLEKLTVFFKHSTAMISDPAPLIRFVRQTHVREFELRAIDNTTPLYVKLLEPQFGEASFPLMQSGNLTHIEFDQAVLDGNLLRTLANYPSLTKLSPSSICLNHQEMCGFAKLPNLTEFTFSRKKLRVVFSVSGDIVTEACRYLPNLRILRILHWQLSAHQLEISVSRLPQLTHLEINSASGQPESFFASLGKYDLPNRLIKLKLTTFFIPVADVRDYILPLHQLEYLELAGKCTESFPDELLNQLRTMPKMIKCIMNVTTRPSDSGAVSSNSFGAESISSFGFGAHTGFGAPFGYGSDSASPVVPVATQSGFSFSNAAAVSTLLTLNPVAVVANDKATPGVHSQASSFGFGFGNAPFVAFGSAPSSPGEISVSSGFFGNNAGSSFGAPSTQAFTSAQPSAAVTTGQSQSSAVFSTAAGTSADSPAASEFSGFGFGTTPSAAFGAPDSHGTGKHH